MTGDGSSTDEHFSCQTGDRKRTSERPTAEELSHRIHLLIHSMHLSVITRFCLVMH